MPSGRGLSRGQPTVGWERGRRTEEQLVRGDIKRAGRVSETLGPTTASWVWNKQHTHSRPRSAEVTELTPQSASSCTPGCANMCVRIVFALHHGNKLLGSPLPPPS